MIGKLIPAGTGENAMERLRLITQKMSLLMKLSYDDENMVLKMPSVNVQPQTIAPLYDGIEE